MSVVVIGGQASGVGKTSVVCGLIAAMPELRWTAIKVTLCSHQESAGKACDCELDGRGFAVSEEHNPTASTDTSRYLAAGALRSVWVRTLPGHLGEAMSRIEQEVARSGNVLIESNSVMEFLRPEVYAMVVSAGLAEFKPTARRHLDSADAVVVAGESKHGEPDWSAVLGRYAGPRFSFDLEHGTSPGFVAFVGCRLETKTA